MAYSYNGILYGNKKGRINYCTSNNMEESQRQIEWKKPHTTEYILYNSTYVKFLNRTSICGRKKNYNGSLWGYMGRDWMGRSKRDYLGVKQIFYIDRGLGSTFVKTRPMLYLGCMDFNVCVIYHKNKQTINKYWTLVNITKADMRKDKVCWYL